MRGVNQTKVASGMWWVESLNCYAFIQLYRIQWKVTECFLFKFLLHGSVKNIIKDEYTLIEQSLYNTQILG